jgi:uncharacterized phiE125 gp8 family phage protein
MISIIVQTKPTQEPLTVAEHVKKHLRISGTAEDDYLQRLISAARIAAEKTTHRALITQTLDYFDDTLPCTYREGFIEVPRPNLLTVTYVNYRLSDGTWGTMDSDSYFVETNMVPGRIVLKPGYNWPDIYCWMRPVLNIRYTAGYGPDHSHVPELLKQGMLTLIAQWYENREDTISGTIIAEVPKAVDYMFESEKVYTF